jgi:glycosyltransferase involved in cell wall biosynthesis
VKLCFVVANFWPGWGGTERQCQLLARALTQRGHAVTVLTRGKPGFPAAACLDGVAVRRTGAWGTGTLRSITWMLTATAWFRRHGRSAQVVQCYQLLSPSYVGLLGCLGRRQAVVMRAECSGAFGDVSEMRRLPLTGLRRALLRRADAVVTISQAIEAELADFGLSGIPSRRIPNAVDCAEFSPADAGARAALRVRLGLPAARVLCAFVGRLAPQKAPELLVDAWLMDALPNAHLVLVGDGPLRSSLERRLAADRERITFVGATADVVSYMRAADLLVLPSQAEGMSGVILEAMACGLPVVATDVPGNRELVGEDGTVGMLVPAGEASGLAEGMGRLVGSPELRQTIGASARAAALERFDIQRVATEYLSLYAGLGS